MKVWNEPGLWRIDHGNTTFLSLFNYKIEIAKNRVKHTFDQSSVMKVQNEPGLWRIEQDETQLAFHFSITKLKLKKKTLSGNDPSVNLLDVSSVMEVPSEPRHWRIDSIWNNQFEKWKPNRGQWYKTRLLTKTPGVELIKLFWSKFTSSFFSFPGLRSEPGSFWFILISFLPLNRWATAAP